MMKLSMPDRHECLSLLAVWLMWPALRFAEWTVFPILAEFSLSLPGPTCFAIRVLYSNRRCIPSIVGTTAIVLAGRFAPTAEAKRFLCHLITLLTFVFTITIMLLFLTVVKAIR
jgi:hypothetical protein